VDADPAHAQARDVLAQSRYNLGLVYRDMNQLPEARAELEAAANLSRAAGSAGANRRWHLARALLNLGAVLRLANEPGPADAAYAESITLLDGLTRGAEHEPKYRRDLARALINRANLQQKDRDAAVTTDLLLRARGLLARLADDFPQTPEYRSELATACNGLAAAAFTWGDRAAAERWLVESVRAWRKVLATHPAVPDHHAGLGMALGNLGRVRLGRGDGRQSVAATVGVAASAVGGVPHDLAAVGSVLEEGLRELAAALRANPEQPECRASLRQQCADVARLAARVGDPGLAIRAADALAAELPTGSVGPVYGAFLLARFAATAGGRSEDRQACADRALALLGSRPAAELAAHLGLLADAAFDGFRRDVRFANLLPRRN
jgi:tetratricopeptide (TPR) repeat protein